MIEREFLVDGIVANASPEHLQRGRESGEILARRIRRQIDVPGGGNRSALSDRRERADHDEPDAMAVQNVEDGSSIQVFRQRETSLPLPTSPGSARRHASICRSLRRRPFEPCLDSSSASTSSCGSLGTRCMLRSNPAAAKSRISVGSVGCRRDRSYAEIIVAGTPARSLSCPWLRPLLIRANCNNAAAGEGI